MDAGLLSNAGTLDAYEKIAVPMGDVKTADQPDYRGEVYLQHQRGSVEVDAWAMSRVRIHVASSAPDNLILNQNFEDGWKPRRRDAQGRVDQLRATKSDRGLISVPIDRVHTDVQLFYLPESFVIGSWVSGGSLAVCLLVLCLARRETYRGENSYLAR